MAAAGAQMAAGQINGTGAAANTNGAAAAAGTVFPGADAAGQTVGAIAQAETISAGERDAASSDILFKLTALQQMRLLSTTGRSASGECRPRKSTFNEAVTYPRTNDTASRSYRRSTSNLLTHSSVQDSHCKHTSCIDQGARE